MNTVDFSKTSMTMPKIEKELKKNKSVEMKVPGNNLRRFLKKLESLDVGLEPTNATTKELICATIAGGGIGAGAGIILSLLGKIPGPIGWVALGTGLVGAGVGYLLVTYRIKITISKQDKKGNHMIKMSPA